MTQAKQPTIATLARRLRDAEQLIAGQRRDFDQLSVVLRARDLEVKQLERALRTAALSAATVADRLGFYEGRGQPLERARKGYALALRREQKRRARLIAAHPDLTAQEKERVEATGVLPEANGQGPHTEP